MLEATVKSLTGMRRTSRHQAGYGDYIDTSLLNCDAWLVWHRKEKSSPRNACHRQGCPSRQVWKSRDRPNQGPSLFIAHCFDSVPQLRSWGNSVRVGGWCDRIEDFPEWWKTLCDEHWWQVDKAGTLWDPFHPAPSHFEPSLLLRARCNVALTLTLFASLVCVVTLSGIDVFNETCARASQTLTDPSVMSQWAPSAAKLSLCVRSEPKVWKCSLFLHWCGFITCCDVFLIVCAGWHCCRVSLTNRVDAVSDCSGPGFSYMSAQSFFYEQRGILCGAAHTQKYRFRRGEICFFVSPCQRTSSSFVFREHLLNNLADQRSHRTHQS